MSVIVTVKPATDTEPAVRSEFKLRRLRFQLAREDAVQLKKLQKKGILKLRGRKDVLDDVSAVPIKRHRKDGIQWNNLETLLTEAEGIAEQNVQDFGSREFNDLEDEDDDFGDDGFSGTILDADDFVDE